MAKNVKVPANESNARTGESGASANVWRVVIPGRLPSLNEYIDEERRNKYRAAQLKAEKQYYCSLWIRKYIPGVRIDRPVYITYIWFEPNRRRDKSNVCAYGRKVIEDALVKAGVLRDDGWDEIAGFSDIFLVNKDDPHIEVIITTEEGTGCSGITTNTADGHTARDVPVQAAPGTTTNTKAMSSAAQDTGDGAASRERRARTTSPRQKTSQKKPAKRRNS